MKLLRGDFPQEAEAIRPAFRPTRSHLQFPAKMKTQSVEPDLSEGSAACLVSVRPGLGRHFSPCAPTSEHAR